MKKILVAIFIIALFFLAHETVYAGDIAVVVINNENVINDISFRDLVKIFKQDKQYWKNGKKIYLIMREAGNPAKKIMLKKIYKMTDEELKKFWLAKMFQGEISAFPQTLGSNESVKRFVSRVPVAIGFIDAEFTDDTVRVLKIDGKLPGEEGYPLKE